MNKTDLVNLVAERTEQPKSVVSGVVDAAFDAIMEAVAQGDTAAFVGFGTFSGSARGERSGRNPSTGETITIAATTLPKFSPGSVFKAKVKTGDGAS